MITWQAILHFDSFLTSFVDHYGTFTYAVLFVIIFCETGLVITPFLPGDSLLFAAGGLMVTSSLHLYLLMPILILAAFLGDNANYWIGRKLGRPWVNQHFTDTSRWLKRSSIDRTEAFYDIYGLPAIFMARFIPLIRTFCPFVAGVARMRYVTFAWLSALAAILWVGLLTGIGYRFANVPIVKAHFSVVILGIIVISLFPAFRIFFRARMKRKV
jgi:membrane-associated protein